MLQIVRNVKELSFLQLLNVYDDPETGSSLGNDFYGYLRSVFFGQYGGIYAMWVEDGSYVSALRLEPYKDGRLLSGIQTAFEHRGKGYGKKLVSAVLSCTSGKVYSHVGKGNLPSLELHKTCGFCRISEMARYLDGSVDSRCCTMLAMGLAKEKDLY